MQKRKILVGVAIFLISGAVVVLVGYQAFLQKLNSSRKQLTESIAEIETRYTRIVNSGPNTIEKNEAETVHASSDRDDEIGQKEEIYALILKECEALCSQYLSQNSRCLPTRWHFQNWYSNTDEEKEEIIKFLEASRGLIQAIREYAKSGGTLMGIPEERSICSGMEERLDFKYFLLIDALVSTLKGDYSEAVQNCLALLCFAEEPNNNPKWCWFAMQSVETIYGNLSHSIPLESVPPDLLLEIISKAKVLQERDAFADSIKIGTRHKLAIFEDMRNGTISDNFRYDSQGFESIMVYVHGSGIGQPFVAMDESAFIDIVNRASELAKLPYYEAKPLLDRLRKEIDSLPGTSIVSRKVTPSLTKHYPIRRACYDAQLGLMQVGLAVELHYNQHGVYPETLDEIAPILDGEIPLDPFTGKDFVYEPNHDKYTLYCQSAKAGHIDTRAFTGNADGNICWRPLNKDNYPFRPF